MNYTCTDIGTTTVVLTAADGSGSDTENCTVTIQDNTNPTAVCPATPPVVNLDANGNGTLAANSLGDGSSTDNCSVTSETNPATNFTCSDIGTQTVVLTASDGTNSGSENCTVTVVDNIAPTAVCQNIDVQLDASNSATLTAAQIDGGSNDNCGVSLSIPPTSFDCDDLGAQTVILTATDPGNNTHACTATVTVKDDTNPCCAAPFANCQPFTAFLTAAGTVTINASDVDNNSTADCGLQSLTIDVSTFDCNDIGTPQNVQLTITDINTDSDNCNATVTVEDNTIPTAMCQNATIQLDANGNASITTAQIDNGSTDNCGTVNLTGVSPNAFTCADLGGNTVTLSMNDGNGNATTCTATVTVEDSAIPTAICQDATVQLDANGDASITAAQIDNNSFDNCGTVNLIGVAPNAFTCSDLGANTVTLSMNDGNGNSTTCTATVTVEDSAIPTAICQDITAQLDANGDASITVAQIDNNSFDNCGTVNLTGVAPNAFTCSDLGGNTVTLSMNDGNGNATTCTATVTVEDSAIPTAICTHANIALGTDGTITVAPETINANSFDNCGTVNLVSLTPNYFTCADIGYNFVTLAIDDGNGNTASCTATITLSDGNTPTANCKNITTQLDANGIATITPAQINNGSTDNCGTVNLTSVVPNTFTCADLGFNTVTLTMDDGYGNIASCNATVKVEGSGTAALTPICQDVTVDLDLNGNASITAAQIDNGSTANCISANLTGVAPNSFTCSDLGANIVTLTVDDGNGNTATCSATVTIQDVTAPTTNCQDATVQLDANGNAAISMMQIGNGSTDNCGTVNLTSVAPSSFDCSDVGTKTVTLEMNDGNGNSTSCTATVTVEDATAPTAICQAATIQLDANGNASISMMQIDNGSSDICGTVNLTSVVPNNFTCSDLGLKTVTLSMNDGNGNSTSCSATVTVEDVTAPTASCQNATVQLDANGNASISPTQIDNGSSDLCGTVNLTSVVPNNFTCSDLGPKNVTLYINDGNGNNASCDAIVTVQDVTAPTASCKDATISLDANGNAALSMMQIDNGSSDACGTVNLTSVAPSSFDCSNLGPNTVTLEMNDRNGNSTSCSATVTVQDVTAPTAMCKDISVQLDANANGSISPTQIDNGSSDLCGTVNLTSVVPNSFTCSDLGPKTVTLYINDGNGNNASCDAIVTVQDVTAPTASCKNATIQLDANGNASISPTQIDNGSSDACGTVNLTSVLPNSFTCSDLGPKTVTLSMNDGNGNSTSCSATVNVQDVTAPTAICQDATVQLDANGNASISMSEIDNGSSDICGSVTLTSVMPSSFTCEEAGANTVTLYMNDGNGNSTSCTATVTVKDDINPCCAAPMAICQPFNAALDGNGSVTISPSDVNNQSTADCGLQSMTIDLSMFDCNHIGTPQNVTLTVVDINNESDNCTAIVTVEDVTAPTAICQDVTVQLDANGNASISMSEIDNGSADNCGSVNLTSVVPNNFTCSDLGANTVTLSMNDGNGNSTTCSATVTVEDVTAPTAICQDVTVQLDANGNASISMSQIDNGSSDNCGTVNLTSVVPNSFTCSDLGANTVTLSMNDGNGNSTTCSATVTVEDVIAPTASCQDATVQLDANGNASISMSEIDNGSADNCGTVNLTSVVPNNFTCSDLGANTVTLSMNDGNGNSTTCSATVTVEDVTAPTAICQDVTVQLDANGNASISMSQIDNGSSDNCGTVNLTSVVPNSFTCSDLGANTVTLSMNDGNGNSTTCSATVTVEDGIAPTASCQDATVQLDANGNASISMSEIDNGSADNCGSVNLTSAVPNNFTCSDLGANTVMLSMNDGNGNSTSCSAIVTVEDATAPIASCQDATVQLDANGNASISMSQIDNGSSDNCGTVNLTSVVPNSFTCSDLGANTVTLSMNDGNGNSTTCSATVTVEDVIAPTASCQDATVQLDANGNASISMSEIDNGSADNCGTVNLTGVAPNAFTCSDLGLNTVTLSMNDGNGNSTTCSATVTVEDVTAPTAICQDATVQLDANGNASISMSEIDNGSADNCGSVNLTSVVPNSFTCSDLGLNTVTLSMNDGNGNSTTCSATVTVEDVTAPTAICQDATVQLDANGNALISPLQINNGSNDNCGIVNLLSVAPNSFDCSNLGTNSVTLSMNDLVGNATTCTATVTVEDIRTPVITRPASDMTVECDGAGNQAMFNAWLASNGDATASDNCTILWGASTSTSATCGTTETRIVTFTVTDLSLNSISTTATFTIEDTASPVFNQYPTDFTMNCNDAIPTATVLTATDLCNGFAPSVDFNEEIIDRQCTGTYTLQRTWTTEDDCGNVETHVRNIFIEDNEAPVFVTTFQAVTTLECTDFETDIPVALTLELSDCDPNAAIFDIIETDEYYSFNEGPVDRATKKVTREYFATDDCGNVSSVTEIFYIVDTKAPELVFCPTDVEIRVERGETGATIAFPEPIFIDDCGHYELTESTMGAGDWLEAPNSAVITITAYDEANNSTTCEFTVTAVDDLIIHHLKEIGVSIPAGSSFTTNDVDWNSIFARPCEECNDIEADPDFQNDFEFLGELHGHRYFISKNEMSPNASIGMAGQYAGYSASINSAEENRFLSNELGMNTAMIGLSDQATEGTFVWENGSALTYENWEIGHPITDPISADILDYVLMNAAGKWQNVDQQDRYFVLEIPCYDVKKELSSMGSTNSVSLGDYETGYIVSDLCGNKDTTTVIVNVVPQNVEYCYPNREKSAIDYDDHHFVTGVFVDGAAVQTGNNEGYFLYNRDRLTTFTASEDYTLQLTSANDNDAQETMYFRVWIDYNSDGDFYDAGEMIYEGFAADGNVRPTQFTIPRDAQTSGLNTTLMRVAAQKYTYPEPCGEYQFGEVEDYPIRVLNSSSSRSSIAENTEKGEQVSERTQSNSDLKSNQFEVFPNPATNRIFINLENSNATESTIQISNQLGKIFFVKQFESLPDAPSKVDLSGYPTGVYFVSLHQKGEPVTTKRLVVVDEN